MNDHKELLQQIYENTNVWLHFAEAKNAAMVALNIAILAAVMSSDYLQVNLWLFSLVVIGLLGSIFIEIMSFWPINKKIEKMVNNNISKNLLNYAYIATLEEEDYLKRLYRDYWEKPQENYNTIPQIEKDYCAEIIDNARITIRKQKMFKKSVQVTLSMIVGLILLVICA